MDAGAAELQPEQKITPDPFAALISNLLGNHRRREEMSAAARTVLPRDAAGNVADEIERAVASQETRK